MHNTGQRHNTGHRRRETTPKVLCKGPENNEGEKSAPQRDIRAFLAAHGLLTTQISRKNCTTHSREEKNKTTKKSHRSLSSEVREHDNSKGTGFFFLDKRILFVHA